MGEEGTARSDLGACGYFTDPEIRLPKKTRKKKKLLKTKLKRNRLQKSWKRGAQSISSRMGFSTTAPMDTFSDITHTRPIPTHIPTISDRKNIWDKKNYLGWSDSVCSASARCHI